MESDELTNILQLNISGTIFHVQASTLLRFPNSRLAKLVEESSSSNKSRSFYFDQDAAMFGHILRCFRSGEIHVPTTVCPRDFLRELDFWGVPVEKIAPCCWPTFYKADDILETLQKLTEVTTQSDTVEINREKLSIRQKMWLFLDNPNYSNGAKVIMVLQRRRLVTTGCQQPHRLETSGC